MMVSNGVINNSEYRHIGKESGASLIQSKSREGRRGASETPGVIEERFRRRARNNSMRRKKGAAASEMNCKAECSDCKAAPANLHELRPAKKRKKKRERVERERGRENRGERPLSQNFSTLGRSLN